MHVASAWGARSLLRYVPMRLCPDDLVPGKDGSSGSDIICEFLHVSCHMRLVADLEADPVRLFINLISMPTLSQSTSSPSALPSFSSEASLSILAFFFLSVASLSRLPRNVLTCKTDDCNWVRSWSRIVSRKESACSLAVSYANEITRSAHRLSARVPPPRSISAMSWSSSSKRSRSSSSMSNIPSPPPMSVSCRLVPSCKP